MPSRPIAQKISYTSTSTGGSGSVVYGTGMSAVSAQHSISGTTKAYTFTLQGSIGYSNVWTNLTAATTGSTSGVVVSSTVTMTFDKVRLNFSANDSTGNGTFTAHVLARP